MTVPIDKVAPALQAMRQIAASEPDAAVRRAAREQLATIETAQREGELVRALNLLLDTQQPGADRVEAARIVGRILRTALRG